MKNNNNIKNDYLALRDAKIKRNKQRLQTLGLAIPSALFSSSVNKSNSSSPSSPFDNKDGKNKSKQAKAEKAKVQVSIPVPALRRSLRTKSSASITKPFSDDFTITTTDNINISNTNHNNDNQSKKRKLRENETSSKISPTDFNKIMSDKKNDAKPGSTKATIIDITKVLYGNFNFPIFIGQQLVSPNKASVIEHANLVCRNDSGISFNRYSGVCEWGNDAMFLWVNIGDPNDNGVKNEFFVSSSDDNVMSNNGGMHMKMTWYGGSKMKAESNTIKKLITIGTKAANNELSPKDGIVLWCRLYNQGTRKFDPYTCLGRLSYHDHDPNAHPIKFVWNLMDYDILKRKNKKMSVFEQIVCASSSL